MTEDDTQMADETGTQRQRGDILDALVAELEADDGTQTATLRQTLDLEPEPTPTAERLEAVEDELASLRAAVDDLAAADTERRTAIENDVLPRLDALERQLRELDDQVTNVRAEAGGLRTEVTGVRDSLEAASGPGSEPDSETDPDIEAVADDLTDLQRTVAEAFRSVTSEVEGDLESLQATFQADIESLEQRLAALETAVGVDADAGSDDSSA
ncbi:hypothetical protein [Natrinema marinum]|uniref:hypothetical protein n=1 Tax=Natrinema marinum TaxID=2961598 RepID=UPI0020C859C9|nr:hypothetical protein [Natrinema marinum]